MINCKYDLLTSEYRDGNYIVYKPDSLSNTTALQVRSTKFDLKPDAKTTKKVMHATLSLASYRENTNVRYFKINVPYDTMNIPQSVDGATFKLQNDVAYDSTVSAEENVKRVIKMYSDEIKQWLFNWSPTQPDGYYQFNVKYVRDGVGGCIYDVSNVISGTQAYQYPRYTASNAYIIRAAPDNGRAFRLFVPTYAYNYVTRAPDSVNIQGYIGDSGYTTALSLSGAMVSPKMQFPDPSRGTATAFRMPFPVTFTFRNGGIRMHYANYTSTSYNNGLINYTGVTLTNVNWDPTLLWTPTAMFWNRGGIHIGYINSSSPRFTIGYAKYSEESSALTNSVSLAYGASEITVNISAVLPNLELDSNHLAMLVPMYHYMIDDENYFVTALFHNEKTASAADPSSFKGLYIICMETGDMYDASTGFNHVKFSLDASFDVTDLLYMYGWQQYDDAAEIGSNAFQYTTTTDGSYTVYTFNSKRIEICPYKAYGNYYLVCNPELYNTWYVYDIDLHKIHMITNVPVSRNHCITPDGMHGFRFEVNNKTDYISSNNFIYPFTVFYDESVINSIGMVRHIPYIGDFAAGTNWVRMYNITWNTTIKFWDYGYKPYAAWDPIELDKTTSFSILNFVSPYPKVFMYFVVDITTDDGSIEFHHKRSKPEHPIYINTQQVDIEYTLTDKTATASAVTPYNNIKVYINEFLNNDMFVCNGNEVIDVELKQTAITSTNQSFRIRLYDDKNETITQEQLRQKYGVASIDLDFLF